MAADCLSCTPGAAKPALNLLSSKIRRPKKSSRGVAAVSFSAITAIGYALEIGSLKFAGARLKEANCRTPCGRAVARFAHPGAGYSAWGLEHSSTLMMGGSFFPAWIDRAKPLIGALALLVPLYVVAVAYYGGSPVTTDVGYQPVQPVPFSHAQHAGDLGMDCRYCHNTVEIAAAAAIPPTATCMNCHALVAPESDKLLLVRQSAADGNPIHWVRVHDLPDYVYFDHSVHISAGVGCVTCHGRVDRMEQVYQAKTLSMSWCLECHRQPEPYLRPVEFVTDIDWVSGDEDPVALGTRLRQSNNINPSTDCSTCHR
jgi:hypothetical protein